MRTGEQAAMRGPGGSPGRDHSRVGEDLGGLAPLHRDPDRHPIRSGGPARPGEEEIELTGEIHGGGTVIDRRRAVRGLVVAGHTAPLPVRSGPRGIQGLLNPLSAPDGRT